MAKKVKSKKKAAKKGLRQDPTPVLIEDSAERERLDRAWREMRVRRRELKAEYDKAFKLYVNIREELHRVAEEHKRLGRERSKYAPVQMTDAKRAEIAFDRARRALAKVLGYDPVEAHTSAAIQTLTTPSVVSEASQVE